MDHCEQLNFKSQITITIKINDIPWISQEILKTTKHIQLEQST